MSKKKSRKEIGSGISGFGFTMIGLLWLFRPVTLIKTALIAGVAYLVGKAIGTMASGLDLTTHNREDRKPEKEFETISTTGDENADAVINKGKEMLAQIREANDAIPDASISRQLYQLEDKCVQIFKTVQEKPAKAVQVRKFMNYYLPTTLKMIQAYRTMQDRGISSAGMAEARSTLQRGIDMVLTACQKQLDNLYRDTMLDVSTDIDVLEQMLKRDGFADSTFSPEGVHQAARTAASAQLGDKTAPTLDVSATPDDTWNNEDFQSYYHQKAKK